MLLPFGVGIPLLLLAIILALVLPLAGGMVGSGLGKIAGPHPHCGHRVTAASRAPGVTCPACARRRTCEKAFSAQNGLAMTSIDIGCARAGRS